MASLLVTGGAGFIGAQLVRQALAAGWRVVALDKLGHAGSLERLAAVDGHPRLRFVQGDIGDRARVARLLAEARPDAIVHCAAESHVDRSIEDPAACVASNVVGTLVLLECATAHWQALHGAARERFRFLHVSTDEVYGSLGAAGCCTEAAAYAPNSPYSASKAASDHLVRAFHRTYGLPVLTTHGCNTYGAFQHPEKLIPRMLGCALAGDELPVFGDGRNVRDWLHVDDHVRALLRVLDAGAVGDAYNIGAGCGRENLHVVEALCTLLDARRPRPDGRPHASRIAFVADRPGHDRRYALDATKLGHGLGWRPEVAFEEGLARTVDWYLANQPWVARLLDGTHRTPRSVRA